MTDELLLTLGRRARAARLERGWTIREVAERSGLSPRFLVQLEAGKGNISVRRLADVALSLDTTPAALLATSAQETPRAIALLGLRGAGKTTIGKRLARRLRVPFVELDRLIEEAANLTLGELFSLHGEHYYRRLEREVMERLSRQGRPMVLATGGGLVTSPESYGLLRRFATTIWLRARPEDHWKRLVRQGDRRPMANHPQAMADLRSLLGARGPLYAQADHTIDTSGVPVQKVVEEVYRRIRAAPEDRRI